MYEADAQSAGKPKLTTTPPVRRKRLRRWSVRLGVVVVTVLLLRFTGCMERLFYYPVSGSVTPPMHLRGVEELAFQSADGTRLHGWLVPARGERADGMRSPTIIHIHGNAGNIESHIGFVDYLPAAGFNIVVFDYRSYGQSESSGKLRREPMLTDALAAVDHVMTLEQVDPQRVALYGQSLGGAFAVHVFARRPALRAMVLESAFTSWRDVAANALGGDPPNWIGRTVARLFIHDGSRPLDAAREIAAEQTARSILLLHGDADTIVPVSHSRRFADVLGDRARLHIVAGGEHNTLRWDVPEVADLVIEFYRQALEQQGHPGGQPG